MFAALSACAVFGEDFEVSTATMLISVLAQAQGNGEDDVITLSPGVYQGCFSYRVRDGKSLVIQGAAGTAPEDVILDGEGKDVVLAISGRSDGAEVTLSGLTVQGGNSKDRLVGGGGSASCC